MARYRPPTNLPTDPAQLAAVLLEHLRRISEDLGTIPTDDVNTVIVQERVDVPAGSTRRISPPTIGGTAVLEPPGPNNAGKRSTILLENPAGPLTVVASPHRAADGKITPSTINDAAQATYTLPGVVTFTSNGVDSWKTQVEAPAETAPSTTTAGLLEALEGTFHVQTADANLPNARVATSSETIEVDHTTGGQARWNLVLPAVHTQIVTGTLNAHVLPATLNNRDTVIFSPSSNVTLNGLDLQDWPQGFEFVLANNSASFTVTINDESGSAIAEDRLSTPRDQQVVLGQSASAIIRRYVTRWGLIERGLPDASTSITYSGFELRRAALTGDVTAAANSNTTAIAAGVIVDADVNASAAIAMTKTGALTGDVTKASGSSVTAIGAGVIVDADVNATAAIAQTKTGALTGDVTKASGSAATVIANDAVTPAKLSHGGIGQTLVSFGSFADPMWCHVLTEQFFGGGATTTISGQWGWGVSNITEQDTVGPEPGHSGIRRYLRAGGGHGYVYAANVAADLGEIDIADVAFLYFVVRIPNTGTQTDLLTSRRFTIGLVQDASDTSGTTADLGGNGLVFMKNSTAAAWRIKDENASAVTNTDTATAVLDDWAECLLVNEGGGNWGIMVNGVDYGTHSGVVTSGVMTPVIVVDATGIDAYFDVDEFTIGFLPSVARFG
jgi:hypothetical protein